MSLSTRHLAFALLGSAVLFATATVPAGAATIELPRSGSATGLIVNPAVGVPFPGVIVWGNGALPRWDRRGAVRTLVGAPPGAARGPCPAPPTVVVDRQLVSGVICNVRASVDGAIDRGFVDSRLRDGVIAQHPASETRALVRRSTVSGDNGYAVGGSAVFVDQSQLTSTNDGIHATGEADGLPSIITNNWIERDGSLIGHNHHDGIQLWQGGNVTIRRNWISGFRTSAILIKSDFERTPGDGPIRNFLIEENYLANPTGHFSVYVRDGGKGRPQYVTIRNNVFGPGSPISTGSVPGNESVFVRTTAERNAAVADGVPGAAAWIVWSNNVYAATGEEIVPGRGWRRYPS